MKNWPLVFLVEAPRSDPPEYYREVNCVFSLTFHIADSQKYIPIVIVTAVPLKVF